jgi:hypothetical protein
MRHVSRAPHALPHSPQWLRSLDVLTQEPSQSVVPRPQTHAPSVHVPVKPQLVPHVPQFSSSVSVSTQRKSQRV